MAQLHAGLGRVQGTMREWDQTTFGSVRKNLAKLRKELERVRGQLAGLGPSRVGRHIMSQISELLSIEEIMEKHRAHLDWLKDGDRNTAFYQAKARERARVNRITSLRTEDGGVVTQPEELENVAETFYTNLNWRKFYSMSR